MTAQPDFVNLGAAIPSNTARGTMVTSALVSMIPGSLLPQLIVVRRTQAKLQP